MIDQEENDIAVTLKNLGELTEINLVFPHQLHQNSLFHKNGRASFIIEETLFFNQFNFHQQKIAFHRATMKAYEQMLKDVDGFVQYIEAKDTLADIRHLVKALAKQHLKIVHCYTLTDDWLTKRLVASAEQCNIEIIWYESPLFLNTTTQLSTFFNPNKKKYFQTSFYKTQRKEQAILIDEEEKPIGGKWSFDAENRKKYPKGKIPPMINFPTMNRFHEEAVSYTKAHFSSNIGELDSSTLYPVTHQASKDWFEQFLAIRFHEFGTYEDAIVDTASILNHSVLTPMLNVGLLNPKYIVERALSYAEEYAVPINSTEGFVRQIIGWREFIRGIYLAKGSQERTTNFWKFKRKIPASFYDGTTGIDPIDITIKKVLKTGYCHHIERLMVLGNFMVLCEFDPDEVYRWFMEMFIDAYDWVMVPNVYGMSQYADGGLMSTKPYISGSNYLKKMSNYKKGPWQEKWDALFWRFMHVHRAFFLKNPRLSMLVRSFDKMSEEKQQTHLKVAEEYLLEIS